MDPHFFFQGKLSREESASALLATLLEQRADFRSFLFRALKIEEPPGPCLVETEHRDLDIRLAYPSAKVVLLIENKVRPGALQVNQLVRYYLQELATNSDCRILCVMVAPGEGTGTSETTRLARHKEFRPTDAIYRISWRELAEFCDLLQQQDPHSEFVRHGLECVQKVIDAAVQEKYPLTSEREIANDVAQGALRSLSRQFPRIGFSFWRGKDYFNIYTTGTDITIYVDLAFRVGTEAPYPPLEILDRQHITATARTQFSLSAKGRKNRSLREEWDRMCRMGVYDVPGVGQHRLAGRWFRIEIPVHDADAAALEQRLADMGSAVINSLERFL